jgi:hypothetical protein
MNRRSRTSSAEFARSSRSTHPVRRNRFSHPEGQGSRAHGLKYLVGGNLLVLGARAKLTLLEEEENIAMSELGSEGDRLRRQRAHDVARAFESLHLEGSDVDVRTMLIAQRYVDGEITIDKPTAAIEARSTDVS